MSKRNTPQRRHNILALLNEQGEVSVDELAKRFETSEVTIRKDLAALESHGLLLRRYGGAITMPQELVAEPGQSVSKYKQAIARAAVKRIREHARIIIDSGSTTAAMIPELGQQPGLVVMTNSLHVANALSELEHEPVLLMTGGTWDPHSESFQGQVAEQVLRSYDFDQLFIGGPGTVLEARAHVGNFVELKNARMGEGAKAGHLTYLGDAEIGARTNIGAGTITCNYDGANKWKTVLGEDVFIGSNNSLVAPVDISSGATTAAGSTITQNVDNAQLAVGRARQKNIDGWKRPEKIKKS